MSKNGDDYSAYTVYHSSWASAYSVLSGFIFTGITLILTLHPEPSLVTVQVALFTFAALLDVFGLLMFRHLTILGFCIRVAPKLPEAFTSRTSTYAFLEAIGLILLPFVVVLLFLLWNLPYLALASGVFEASWVIFSYFTNTKPFFEFYKEHPYTRK